MKSLLVISNHNPVNWDEKQKKGWREISYYPFPNIDPKKTQKELMEDEVKQITDQIGRFYTNCEKIGVDAYVTLQGEFSVCFYTFMALAPYGINFIFPTTERVVEEVQKEDGTIEKKSVFRFVKWR